MTYSIVARSKDGLLLGVGVVSGSFNVGSRVPWIEYKVAAVATQAYTNPMLGKLIIEYVKKGFKASRALNEALKFDSGFEFRQVAVITISGDRAYYNGKYIPKPYAVKESEYCICIGNLLASEEVVDKMLDTFLRYYNDLIKAIIEALRAGHEAGGDARGDQSAALLISGDDVRLKGKNLKISIASSTNPIRDITYELNRYIKR